MGKRSVGVTVDRIRIETKTRFGQFGDRSRPLCHPAAISVARVDVRRWNDHSPISPLCHSASGPASAGRYNTPPRSISTHIPGSSRIPLATPVFLSPFAERIGCNGTRDRNRAKAFCHPDKPWRRHLIEIYSASIFRLASANALPINAKVFAQPR